VRSSVVIADESPALTASRNLRTAVLIGAHRLIAKACLLVGLDALNLRLDICHAVVLRTSRCVLKGKGYPLGPQGSNQAVIMPEEAARRRFRPPAGLVSTGG
jgi:hypothetical protein